MYWFLAGSAVFVTWQGQGFSLFCCMQKNCAAHPVSYPLGINSCFPMVKAASTQIWQNTSCSKYCLFLQVNSATCFFHKNKQHI